MYALQLIAYESITLFVENKEEAEALFREASLGNPNDKGSVLLTFNEVSENEVVPGLYDTLRARKDAHVNFIDTKCFLTEQNNPWKITVGRKVLASSKDFPANLDKVRIY